MRIVVALGGNALLQQGEAPDITVQRCNAEKAAAAISNLVQQGHEVVVTHGNGPQVGLLALQAEAYAEVPPYPFDVLDAESQSLIGYLLQQALGNALPERQVVTVITQTLVDAADPAWDHPTKGVGPIYTIAEAEQLRATRGWQLHEERGGYRRVMPSPIPQDIVELDTIRLLMKHGVVVICAGGGGVPVVREQGKLRGVEAVVDKDRSSALLAIALRADRFIILTDVAGIYDHYDQENPQLISHISAAKLRDLTFPKGNMGPKVEAVCDFVTNTGLTAAIGHLTALPEILRGKAGTRITDKEIGHGA